MGADISWFGIPGSQLEQVGDLTAKGRIYCHSTLQEKQEGANLGRGEGEVGESPEETGFTETK
jgi:hypothetical protein